MQQVEESGKLPTVNVDARVRGAVKFAQLGKDAALAILQSAVDSRSNMVC